MCLLLTAFLALPACYYDVEEELYLDTGCDVANVTYSGTILPILQSNCYICHNKASNFGNVTLEGYSNVKNIADSGRLLGAIRHQDGYFPMPQNQPQLPACIIEKIETWVTEGALDN